jgi:3-hydroxyisobutyrate dehydrogenase-like beta-hydroxyacid dehydrogenase
MQIGFIGLGHMGRPMAKKLIAAGHQLTLYNRTPEKARSVAGAKRAERPEDAAGGEVVITMLAGDEAVEQIVLGEHGILGALAQGAIHLSMSTISVALSDRLAAAHAAHGQIYVAAPVLGRPEAAEQGQLFILAAGPEKAITRCDPLFGALGRQRFVIGDRPSQANLVKLSCNFMIAAMIESLGEAMALVRKGGVDAHRYIEILTGSLFAAPVFKTYGALIADEKFEPAGFPLAMGLKDVRLALAAADAEAVPMPFASLVHDHFLAGVAQGKQHLDWSSLADIAAANAGLIHKPGRAE